MIALSPSGTHRILVIRPDRLGDVILSTPVLEALRAHFPQAHLTFCAQAVYQPLFKGADHAFLPLPKDFSPFRLFEKNRWDLAIVLQGNWKIALALFLSGIPIRIGPLGSLASFVFYSHGIRQKRSRVELHEADYNLQLLQLLGVFISSRSLPTRVFISDTQKKSAYELLLQKGWNSNNQLIAIHPGMGGSALNVSEAFYERLIRRCLNLQGSRTHQILMTAGSLEKALLERIQARLGVDSGLLLFYQASETSSIDFLGALFSLCDLVVAPSTGPLHLAVALGKPVVSFYPPIRVQSVKRWGPYSDRSFVLTPAVKCGEIFRCRGASCPDYFCMNQLNEEKVFHQIQWYLNSSKEK